MISIENNVKIKNALVLRLFKSTVELVLLFGCEM